MTYSDGVKAMDTFYERACNLPVQGAAFDLGKEDKKTKAAYGRIRLVSLLMKKSLVETVVGLT